MFLASKNVPLDAGFDDRQFENIFLHNRYPEDKGAKPVTGIAEKAELWALFEAPARYNGLNLLRQLRSLWGIHLTLQIGPRSDANKAPRGVCRIGAGKGSPAIYFEGYSGNISDATRDIITFAPYGHAEKSRALSQKFFIRLVVPLKGLAPLAKIEAVLAAYSVAAFMDKKNFVGIVDPDIFVFVPPASVRAGLAHFHREDRLLNTHLVSGFNFYEKEGAARFFTHGLGRFGMADVLIGEGEQLTTGEYTAALRRAHGIFLSELMGSGKKEKFPALKKRDALPGQVAAMLSKNVVLAKLPGAQG